MGKVLSVPESIPKADISKEGTKVLIKEARIAKDVFTELGTVKKALGLTVELNGEMYSHLFGLDKEVIAGSVGRLLVAIDVQDTDDKELAEKVKALEGTTPTVKNRGGKLYWYP